MSDWPDEEVWLRAWIIRLRTLLRFAIHPQVEAGLKEFIAEAERRLEQLQREHMIRSRMRRVDSQVCETQRNGRRWAAS
jgi:hypothetical protein